MDISPPGPTPPAAARRPFTLDPRWLVLLPAMLVFLVYLPAVRYGFVWDDTIFLRDMPAYRDPNLWLPSLFQPFVLSPNYFRPLALLTFVAELNLVGLNPALFHLTNVLLHTVNTALVALLALHLLGRATSNFQLPTSNFQLPTANLQPPTSNFQLPTANLFLALGAGLLYGLHPAQIEGVAFISSRFDLLMTVLLLAALLVDVYVRGRLLRALLVGLLFLLAALSKEMAAAFALVLPLWYLARAPEQPLGRAWWQRAWRRGDVLVFLAVVVGGLLYLLIRYASLGYLVVSNVQETIPAGNVLQRLLLVAKSFGAYVLITLWPFTTIAPIHFGDLPVPVGDALAWLSVIVVGLVAAGLVVLLRRAPRAGWLALAGVVSLLPVLNIVPLELGGGNFIAERYLLFPLLWLAWAAADLAGLADLAAWGRSLRASWKPALLALWLLGALATVQLTLPNWQSDLALWTWGAQRAPRSSTPPTNLSLQYTNRGQYELALRLADQAIQLDPQNADAWDNAGIALFHLGRYPEAQQAFEQAIKIQPQSALYWNNLAGALREQGDLGSAEVILLDTVLQLDRTLPVAYLNLGIVYLRADRPDMAAAALQDAVQLLPPDQAADAQYFLEQTREPDRWLRLGYLLLGNGYYQESAQAFDQARIYGANEIDVKAGLSAALIGLQDYGNATALLNQALAQSPYDPRLHYNSGLLAQAQGQPDQAREHFVRALELSPHSELAINLGAALIDLGDYESADLALEQAWQQSPNDPRIYYLAGVIARDYGQDDEARSWFAQAAALTPTVDLAVVLSTELIELGDYDTAGQVLDRALGQAPNEPRLHYNAGVLLQTLGEIERARTFFARAAELAPDWELPQQALQQLP